MALAFPGSSSLTWGRGGIRGVEGGRGGHRAIVNVRGFTRGLATIFEPTVEKWRNRDAPWNHGIPLV